MNLFEGLKKRVEETREGWKKQGEDGEKVKRHDYLKYVDRMTSSGKKPKSFEKWGSPSNFKED